MARELRTSEKVAVIAYIAAMGLAPLLREVAPAILTALHDACAFLFTFWPLDSMLSDDMRDASLRLIEGNGQ